MKYTFLCLRQKNQKMIDVSNERKFSADITTTFPENKSMISPQKPKSSFFSHERDVLMEDYLALKNIRYYPNILLSLTAVMLNLL